MTDHFDFGNVQPVKALDCELHGLGAHGRKVDFFAHHFAVVKHDAHVVPPAQLAQHLYQRHFVKIEKSLDPLGERVGVHVLNVHAAVGVTHGRFARRECGKSGAFGREYLHLAADKCHLGVVRCVVVEDVCCPLHKSSNVAMTFMFASPDK